VVLALAGGCAMRAVPPPGASAPARFQAARAADRAGKPAAAWRILAPVKINGLPVDIRFVAALFKARLALELDRPRAALAALAAAPAAADEAGRIRYLALEGRAQFALDAARAALHALVARGRLLQAPDRILANDRLIWNGLSNVAQLPSLKGLSPEERGWVALAKIFRASWETPAEFSKSLSAWRKSYPNHPANSGLLAEILAAARKRTKYPSVVALLLPLSGPHASQARAVEAGILAAYFQGGEAHPALQVYDTEGSASGAVAALDKARRAGAGFILGPLTAPGVRGVAQVQDRPPVLALNYLGGVLPPDRFYQFGLSPAAESRAVARRALARGLRRAAVLIPDNAWGQRMRDAFAQTLERAGGQVLVTARFRPGAERFAQPLSALFGLDASTAREQRLSTVLGMTLGFSPRRRQDIQFLFFAAPFATARLIGPQVAYYQGLGLPVYSLANIYRPGGPHPDLAGVVFPIMPWFAAMDGPVATLRQRFQTLFPEAWSRMARLYALGYDSWRLVPLLANYPRPLAQPVRGVTGVLSLGAERIIGRRLDWAEYDAGGNMIPLLDQRR